MLDLPLLPGDVTLDTSQKNKFDNFYALPDYVEKFLERTVVPEGVELKPWTLNRGVSVFVNEEFRAMIVYEFIEDNDESEVQLFMDKLFNDITGET